MLLPEMVLYEMKLLDHVVAAFICIVAPVLSFTSGKFATDDIQLEQEEKIGLYHGNALLLTVFMLVVISIWRLPGRTLFALGITWPEWNSSVAILLLAITVFYTLDIFLQYGLRRWRKKSFQLRHATFSFVPVDGRELFHFLFLALAAGTGEEIIFRGYLIHYITFWAGTTPEGILTACVLSSALFAFLHGYQGFKSMVKIFFLAMLFTGVYIMSKSLLLVIIMHILIDVLSGWLGIYLLRQIQQEKNSGEES
jgi:membrane protease YdiL (CAAX protease family)